MSRRNRGAVVVVAFAAALGFGALTVAGTAQATPVHVHGINGGGQNAITDGIQGSGARPGAIVGGGQS